MVQFNTKDNEILVKIVFYGPGLSGKTTNLQKIHEFMDPNQRTDLFSVNTMEDRTLFFDLLPVDLGYVYGNAIKLQIYTVPGQVHYDSTRRIVLSGADGIVFVADSDKSKMEDNVQSINNLYHNLQANRLDIKEMPLVMQYNKRDLPNVATVAQLNQKLNFRNVPAFESVAVTGEGVLETFVAAIKLTVRHIFEKYKLSKSGKNVDNVVQKLEQSIIAAAKKAKAPVAAKKTEAPANKVPPLPDQNRTVLKYTHNVNRDDTESKEQLLKKAITSNMETARLYTELKKTQDALVRKNDELNLLYRKLEKSNGDNLKIRRFLESLVNFAGEAIVTFNELWIIQNWNQAAEELFGYKRGEAISQNVNILFPEEVMGDLNRVISYVNQGKVVRGFQTKLRKKDGHTLQVNITFSPIKNQNDTIVAFAGIIRDLSFMSQATAQLQKLQRFESLSHVLQGLVGRIRHSIPADQSLTKLLLMVEGLASSDSTPGKVNLNQVVEEIHLMLEPMFTRLKAGWQTQLFPKLSDFKGSQGEVIQAILNIVINALEAIKEGNGSRITIGTHSGNGEIMMQIIDNGSGLTTEELAHVYEPSLDGQHHFRGLRFGSSRDLIHRNGGAIRIESAKGKGTKITLKFRAIQA